MSRILAIQNDPQFRKLQVVTDDASMHEIFQRQLPGFADGRLQLERLKLMEIHYEPGKRCLISYGLQVRDLANGTGGRQFLLGVVEPGGEAETSYAKAQHQPHAQPMFGPALHFLPELSMVVWGFPNDPELKHLYRLLDDNTLSELFRKFWSSLHLSPAIRLVGIGTKVIKCVPERRCTLRHELRLAGANDLVIYSKTFGRQTSAERVCKAMEALCVSSVCQSGDIVIPEPLFVEREMNAIFVRGLEGAKAEDELENLDRIALASGVALAGIHNCSIEDLPRYSDEATMLQVAEAGQILGSFDAIYEARVNALAEVMRDQYPGLTSVVPAPIHNAFRLSQLLLVDGKLALIDFDDFQLGNPISDVGSFVAHLIYWPLKGMLTPEQSRSAIRCFCRAYAERAPWGMPTDVLAWQTAAHLVGKHAKSCVKNLKKNSRDTIDHLLSMAANILAGKMVLA